MFNQSFLSPQVKQCAIIAYKRRISELPQELPNNLRLKFLGNSEISGKCLNPIEWYPSVQPPRQIKNFLNPSKKPL